MAHPDQKYIDALLTNDAVLLDELYEKFSGKVKWMVIQNNGTEDDAADIFQDALLCIYNKARTGDFVLTCPLDAFLHVITKNKWLNELSKKKSHRVTNEDDSGYINSGVDTFLEVEEISLWENRKELMMMKVAELGEGCRELLQLSWSGKHMDEVASILKISYGYARKKKCECMDKLITLIRNSPDFDSLKW
jgi:RNA polymerase sigma factor (sigma-70 family)